MMKTLEVVIKMAFSFSRNVIVPQYSVKRQQKLVFWRNLENSSELTGKSFRKTELYQFCYLNSNRKSKLSSLCYILGP